jgi:hypothetical protein
MPQPTTFGNGNVSPGVNMYLRKHTNKHDQLQKTSLVTMWHGTALNCDAVYSRGYLQSGKDDHPLERVAHRGGDRSQRSQHHVLQVIVEVETHAAQEYVLPELLDVRVAGQGSHHLRRALPRQGEGQRQQQTQQRRHGMLVGRVQVSAGLPPPYTTRTQIIQT